MNRLLVHILLSPRFFYRKLGVNIAQLKAILSTKLLMDERRPNSLQQVQQKKSDKPTKASTLGTMIMAAFLGIVFIFPLLLTNDHLTQFTLFFTLLVFFLSMMLITDFTSVLIEVRDNLIILPKPVNEKTFLLARLLHIIAHVSKIVLPMCLPSFIYLSFNIKWHGVIVLMLLIPFSTLLSIFIINMVYLIILKITTPEKFKTIISYIQIVFSIVVYGSYQLLPRLMKDVISNQFIIPQKSILLFCPPYWFAGGWLFLYEQHFTPILFSAFLLSILIPILCIWLVIKYFAPAFTAKLSLISGSVTDEISTSHKKVLPNKKSRPFKEQLVNILTNTNMQRMGFLHTWYMTARSRDFKMKVYPSIGYVIVLLVLSLFKIKQRNFAAIVDSLKVDISYIITGMYFSGFILLIALGQLKISAKWKASWIYYTTPITTPGNIINGAVKALIIKFFAIPGLIVFIVGITVGGIAQLPNLLLCISNQLFITYLIAYLSINMFPFSEDELSNQRGKNFLYSMMILLIPVCIGGMHYLFYNNIPIVIIMLCLSAIAVWLVHGSVNELSWSKIKIKA